MQMSNIESAMRSFTHAEMEKMGMKGNGELIRYALQHGLLE